MRPRPFIVAVLVGAFIGLLFASVSTYDFARHVDRQVHDLHCSFVPGMSGPSAGETGCQVTMLSPYSSVWRTWIWGGVPISLPAMAVFAFLLFYALDLVVTRRQGDPRATGFLALATGLPALASLVMGVTSLVALDAVCKLCVGIYAGSAVALVGGLGAWWTARGAAPDEARLGAVRTEPPPRADDGGGDPAFLGRRPAPAQRERPVAPAMQVRPIGARAGAPAERVDWSHLARAFGIGVLFVVVPVAGYVAAMPDHERFIGQCGTLPEGADDHEVLVPLGPQRGGAPAIEVLDPLCPACAGFERRLDASGLAASIDRRILLLPLDNACNWMVDEAVHPGACAVSEAVLCAGDGAAEVLAWSFEHQAEIRAAAGKDPNAAGRMVTERFPDLARCVGSPAVRARLNRALRWAVSRSLPVLTPQLYLDGVKLCDEDVDLGLDFALRRMLDAHADGRLRTIAGAPADTVPAEAPPTAASPVEAEVAPPRAAPEDERASAAAEPAPATGAAAPEAADTSGELVPPAGTPAAPELERGGEPRPTEKVDAPAESAGGPASDQPEPPAPASDDDLDQTGGEE